MIFNKKKTIESALEKHGIEFYSLYANPKCYRLYEVIKEKVDDLPDFTKAIIYTEGCKITLAFDTWRICDNKFYCAYNVYVDFDERTMADILEKKGEYISKIVEIVKGKEDELVDLDLDDCFDRPNEIELFSVRNDKCYLTYDDGVEVCLDDCSWELVGYIYNFLKG